MQRLTNLVTDVVAGTIEPRTVTVRSQPPTAGGRALERNGRYWIRRPSGNPEKTVSPQKPGAESGAVGADQTNATTPEVKALLDALLSLPPSARAEFLALIQRTDSTACRT